MSEQIDTATRTDAMEAMRALGLGADNTEQQVLVESENPGAELFQDARSKTPGFAANATIVADGVAVAEPSEQPMPGEERSTAIVETAKGNQHVSFDPATHEIKTVNDKTIVLDSQTQRLDNDPSRDSGVAIVTNDGETKFAVDGRIAKNRDHALGMTDAAPVAPSVDPDPEPQAPGFSR